MNGDQQYFVSVQTFNSGRLSPYVLRYVFNPDAQRIETRYVGPSEIIAAASTPIYSCSEGWQTLEWRVERSSYVVLLAKWRLDDSGALEVGYVRTTPFIEVRILPLEPFSLMPDFQWRPLVDGKGTGVWRN